MDCQSVSIPDPYAAFLAVKEMPEVLPTINRRKFSVKDAKAGSYVRFNGIVYRVEEKSEYREGKQWKWYELKLVSLLDGGVIFLEWEQDDKLEAAIWEVGMVRFGELGITQNSLDRFDENEDGNFTFRGKKFFYDESSNALWYSGCQGKGVPFYYYDFYHSGGQELLSVEKWDDKLEVSLGRVIDPKNIEILVV